MIRECFRVDTGIQFYREAFKGVGLDPDTFLINPRPPALDPTAARVAQAKTAAHAAEPSDGTLVDEAQASPTAATTFVSEEDEEFADAVSPLYDQLKLSKAWWILEVLPVRAHEQNRSDYKWNHEWRCVFLTDTLFLVILTCMARPQNELGSPTQTPRTSPGTWRESLGAPLCKDPDGSCGAGRREV